MKISLNWLKQFIEITESSQELDELLTGTGLEVESIERHEAILGGLQGFVVGEVLTCERFEVKEKQDRKSTRLNSSHVSQSRMPSSA